jgi:ABC-2 type transport system permease protein
VKEIKALYLVNAKEFLRDRMPVLLVLVLPVALAIFFGLIFGGGDGDWTLQLGVVMEDTGPTGAQFLEELQASVTADVFEVQSGTRSEMLEALKVGDVGLVLLLPQDMTTSLGAGSPVDLEVFYDSTRATVASPGLSLVGNLISKANLALSGAPVRLVMVEKDVQTNRLRSVDLFMPGMLGIALLWLGLFGTAIPLVQQRAGQVLRRLSVTPLRPATMLASQVSWRVTVGLLQAALFVLVGYLAFKVGVQGSKLLFAGTVLIGTLVFVSMGYLLAGLAASEEALMALVQIVNFPLMMLSGGLFPVDNLPSFFKPLIAISPLTYLTDALKQLMVGAPALNPLWLNFAVLGGWLVVLFGLGVKFWRWE